MKKIAIHTLGCKLNYAESSTLGREFVDAGFTVVEPHEPADVFLLNTCSVTERADKECRQLIRRALRTSPEAFVIVTGCYAQLQPQEIASIDGVDLIVGTKDKFRLSDLTDSFAKKAVPHIFVSCIDEADDYHSAYSAEVGGRTRAFLKVQDGCDYVCSFCTIPEARGKSRSAQVAEILRQAETLSRQGYKEIVLTGVNVGDFGRNIGTSLIELLRALENVNGIQRYRVSSIEPNLLTIELIDVILGSEKFCNHFHIPLQSGSDTILKKMRRRYDTSHYRNVIEYIKTSDPAAGIGVDVITGFPGETDDLFEETCRFLDELPISYLHVFTYSERPGTSAATLPNAVDLGVRYRRNEVLREMSRKKRHEFYSANVGRILPVLFESSAGDGSISGFTSNYIRISVKGGEEFSNTIVPVRIDSVDDEICTGSILSSNNHSHAGRVAMIHG
jgi:threonylcarbamoyladenosine tRNA methylthiotransferase MtaB